MGRPQGRNAARILTIIFLMGRPQKRNAAHFPGRKTRVKRLVDKKRVATECESTQRSNESLRLDLQVFRLGPC